MAINVTTAYREALKQSAITTKFKADIIIDGVSHTVYDEDLSDKSPQTDYSISSGNEIGFGTAGSASFSCEIINKDYLWSSRSLIGAKIVPSMGIVIPETGLPEYVTLGTFIIDDAFVNGTVVEIKALDEMVLLDKYTLADLTGVIYPCSHLDMYNQICNFMSMRYVEFFPDSNWLIPDLGEDKSKKTLRDVLSFIAFCSAGYARITRDGLLEIRRLFPDTAFKNEIANSNSKEIKVGVQPSVITGLSYEHRDNPIELGNDDGVNISIKPDNLSPFVYSETEPDPEGDGRDEDTNIEEIRLILNNVFEKINGKEYYPFTSSVIQDPSMEVGDFATIQSIDNTGEPLMVDSIITDIRFRYFDTWAAVSCKGSTKVTAGLATGRDKTIGDAAMSAGKTIKRIDRRYDRELKNFADLTALNKGLFSTIERREDGSNIYYEHDKPLLSESEKIWKQTADVYSYSFDGGATWHGLDVYGNQMANIISAIGVKAEWVTLDSTIGDKTLAMFIDEMEADLVASQEIDKDFQTGEEVYTSLADDGGSVELKIFAPSTTIGPYQVISSKGRINLIKNGNFADDLGWTLPNGCTLVDYEPLYPEEDGMVRGLQIAENMAVKVGAGMPYYNLTGGKTITISGEAKASEGISFQDFGNLFSFDYVQVEGESLNVIKSFGYDDLTFEETIKGDDVWYRFYGNYTFPEDSSSGGYQIFLQPVHTNPSETFVLDFTNFKVELGDNPTMWMPDFDTVKRNGHPFMSISTLELNENWFRVGDTVYRDPVDRRWKMSHDDSVTALDDVHQQLLDNIPSYSEDNYVCVAQALPFETIGGRELIVFSDIEATFKSKAWKENFDRVKEEQEGLEARLSPYESQLKILPDLISMHIDDGLGFAQAMTLAHDELAFYLEEQKKVWIGLNGLNADNVRVENTMIVGNHQFMKMADTEYTWINWVGG